MVSVGLKKKLTISPCTVNGEIKVDSSQNFEVMLNPSSFKHDYSIQYNPGNAIGNNAPELKFDQTQPEKVNFDIVLDGTGVVAGGSTVDVKTQVEQLRNIVYTYDGTQHEPNVVRVLWGSFIFYGRLTSMSVEYNLFKPSGEPLRSKVSLAFTQFMGKDEASLRANRTSPDLTHIVEIREGDSLPLLCYQIYKNSSYYPDIAKVNNLVSFRDLKPGTRLHFPPLR